MRTRSLAALAALYLTTGHALAQESARAAVGLDDQCSHHPLGARLMYETRQELQRSATLVLEEDSPVRLAFVCLRTDDTDPGDVTFAYTLTMYFSQMPDYSVLIRAGVGYSGRYRLEDSAKDYVAKTDMAVMEVKRAYSSGAFNAIIGR